MSDDAGRARTPAWYAGGRPPGAGEETRRVGWVVPTWLSIGMVAVMGLTMMGIAIAEFSKAE